MNLEFAYTVLNIFVSFAWALLLFAPKWRWTYKLVHTIWIHGLLCLSWTCLLLFKSAAPEGSGIGSLEQFMGYFTSPESSLQFWTQLVAWDLFIGAWVGRDAIRYGIHHGLVVLCLVGVFVLPPLGLLAYFLVRLFSKRVQTLDEIASQPS